MLSIRRVIEHVYLTSTGGTALAHLSRVAPDGDPDLIASMFTAVQSFMDDSFRAMGAGHVRSIEMGTGHHVAFGRGKWVLLYVLYRGRESNKLERQVEELVRDLEARFGPILKDWNGDMDRVGAVKEYLERTWGVDDGSPPVEPEEAVERTL